MRYTRWVPPHLDGVLSYIGLVAACVRSTLADAAKRSSIARERHPASSVRSPSLPSLVFQT
jgi:hypothetical protein